MEVLTLKKLGFTDVNNALAYTIEALKNTPGPSQPPLNKIDIATLVKDVVAKENDKLRTKFQSDMMLLRTDVRIEAKSYADQINFELRSAITNLEQVLGQSMQVVKNLCDPPSPLQTHLVSSQTSSHTQHHRSIQLLLLNTP